MLPICSRDSNSFRVNTRVHFYSVSSINPLTVSGCLSWAVSLGLSRISVSLTEIIGCFSLLFFIHCSFYLSRFDQQRQQPHVFVFCLKFYVYCLMCLIGSTAGTAPMSLSIVSCLMSFVFFAPLSRLDRQRQ